MAMNSERSVNLPAPMHITADRSVSEDSDATPPSTPTGRAALRIFKMTICLTATTGILSPVLRSVVSQSAVYGLAGGAIGLGFLSACLVPWFDENKELNEDETNAQHSNYL
jgi:hypothetical protein